MSTTHIAVWNGMEIPCCERHAKEISVLAEYEGRDVPIFEKETDAECVNCLNEITGKED